MNDFSPEQDKALQIAHDLVDMGVPIFSAPPHTEREFALPDAWQTFRPNHVQVERWRPGWCLAMVCGVVFDVLDVDPRNGGEQGWADLARQGAIPTILGQANTPSGGVHHLISRIHLAKSSKAARGVDLQAGADDGQGRGFVYLAPTVRLSKWGAHEGALVAYRWTMEPSPDLGRAVGDTAMVRLREIITLNRGARRPAVKRLATVPADPDQAAFYDDAEDWTPESADRVIKEQLAAVQAAQNGEINNVLGGAARVLGRFVAGGFLDEGMATGWLLQALEAGAVHDDAWNAAHGKGWTAGTVIGAGLANGAEEPWTVVAETAPAGANAAGAGSGQEAPSQSNSIPSVGAPRLQVTSAADMAYWLQNALGAGNLSGYFLRHGRLAHTPRVDEAGYVTPRADEDENGPVQIQEVSSAQLAAKIQYSHYCYKTIKDKETKAEREVPALFPHEAAKRATDAPEAMTMLRSLAGITTTPMVRADGSVLEKPGYDRATRYLFLPGPGVNVRPVPEAPNSGQVGSAVDVLQEMLAGFPWDTVDDRANYLGLLLTPMLRLITPPSYKMFGITAHQPGSGKTLLADVARILHGGVLRSEMPTDEAEVGKMTTSLLATTSAPVVHIDNVTGVLRSARLAGLLTADGEIQERELGSHRNLTFVNDRVWVVTGNNLSLGGDLVRRTIVINIDPNMANPETRSFAIADLKAWTAENRNRLLWALLVMIRAWVAAGRPLAARKQSDSFAGWEASVAGILAVCGVPGAFDAMSGQKAAVGGDDDGLSQVLEHIRAIKGDAAWTVAEILSGIESTELGDFVAGGREWLPSPVLDKLARSEAAGRKTFGYWIQNRKGRWVTTDEGVALVLRRVGKTSSGMAWRVEQA